MREAFAPIDPSAVVFRMCKTDGVFLPDGHQLPTIGWLQPNSREKEDAERRGRRHPGITVWDTELTTQTQARTLWAKGGERGKTSSFRIKVGRILDVSAKHLREVAVVADPLIEETANGGEGHCLAEGLRTPPGAETNLHKVFLADLVQHFEPMPEAA